MVATVDPKEHLQYTVGQSLKLDSDLGNSLLAVLWIESSKQKVEISFKEFIHFKCLFTCWRVSKSKVVESVGQRATELMITQKEAVIHGLDRRNCTNGLT